MAVYNRRGNFCSFSLDYRSAPLMRAMRDFQANAHDEIEKLMRMALQFATAQTKTMLKMMADPSANATMPYGGKVSKPIHVRVAENIRFAQTGEMEFAFFAAPDEASKERGVLGRRGGRLSHIVAKGMDTFRYGKLPPLVWSSVPYYTSAGFNRDTSAYMKMRVYHPGYYRTTDYISFAQQIFLERIREQTEPHLIGVGVRAGFSATASKQIAAGKSLFTKSNVGGRGIMRARA